MKAFKLPLAFLDAATFEERPSFSTFTSPEKLGK